MKLMLKLALLAGGLAYFTWYISGLGLARVWEAVLGIGPWAPLLLVPYFTVYLVDCLAWSRILPGKIRFLTLFRIRWAGESLNQLVPSAYIGGEAAKVLLLRWQGISAAAGTASAVVSKSAQTVAQFLFVLCASLGFFLVARDQSGLRGGIVIVLLGGFTALAGLFWIQKAGIFRVSMTLLRTIPFAVRHLESKKARLVELDQAIIGFYRRSPGRFYQGTALYFWGWMLDTVEVFLFGRLVGMPISWTQALVVEAFTGVAKVLGMWIPGSIGVQESGIVLVGRLAGLPDTLSAAYALVRRARELIFAGIGMFFFYSARRTRGAAESNPAESRI